MAISAASCPIGVAARPMRAQCSINSGIWASSAGESGWERTAVNPGPGAARAGHIPAAAGARNTPLGYTDRIVLLVPELGAGLADPQEGSAARLVAEQPDPFRGKRMRVAAE